MSNMFSGCSSLKSIKEISNWETGNLTYIDNIFYNCTKLSSDEISNWKTKIDENNK